MRRLAGCVLLAGLLGTILLYRGEPGPETPPEEAQVLPPLGPGDFKKSAREMEVLGGKTLVILEGWQRRLATLGRENGPALLAAVGSLTVAGVLLWLGGPPTEPPSSRPSRKDS